MTLATRVLTAGFLSSYRCDTSSESRSSPSVSCVRSFDPIEKPSKTSANSSARMTLLGISHMTYTSRPFSPCFSPNSAIVSMTFRPSSGVLQNGTITFTFLRPLLSRTRFRAAHSRANAGLNLGS